jgi:hypothetical protein
MIDWMPPLIGEEPEELEEAEDKVEGDEEDELTGNDEEKANEDSKETESVEPPPSAIEVRKTRAQRAKEKEAAEEQSSSAGVTSSDAVQEVTPSKVQKKKGPSDFEAKAWEECRSKVKQDKPQGTPSKVKQDKSQQGSIFRFLKPAVEKPGPIGHPTIRKIPVAK